MSASHADRKGVSEFPPSIGSIENVSIISMARREGLAQTMATFLLKRPRRPDPLDPSIEKPRRLSDLENEFFAALRDLKLVDKIADLSAGTAGLETRSVQDGSAKAPLGGNRPSVDEPAHARPTER